MNSSMGIQLTRTPVSQTKFGNFRPTDWRPSAFFHSERTRIAGTMTLMTHIWKLAVTSIRLTAFRVVKCLVAPL